MGICPTRDIHQAAIMAYIPTNCATNTVFLLFFYVRRLVFCGTKCDFSGAPHAHTCAILRSV